ncbi:MAG: AAA family ATPase [Planctomycetota bacterium]|jgi:ATP-dependent Clp protease ATP-binding subunit ClpC
MGQPRGLDEVYRIASEEARRYCGMHLLVEGLWGALCQVDDSIVSGTFAQQKLETGDVAHRMRAEAIAKSKIMKTPATPGVRISSSCFRHMKQARARANRDGRVNPSASDLLAELIVNMDVEVDTLLRELGSSRQRMSDAFASVAGDMAAVPAGGARSADELTPTLEQYGTNYRELAKRKELGPVIGRRAEMLQVVQILSRKEKNNPVLVGEPGVGKTAIVEGLALKAMEDSAPDAIRGKSIIGVTLASLVAGTRYRGDFEERLQNLLNEAQRDKNVILFVDEIHTMVGAGAAGDALDAANIMKPALARGQVRLIGATTTDEYQRYVERDSALERRFQMITVPESTPEETLEILEGLREPYEAHHQVTFSEGALKAAIDLTVRYVPERRLPDKARDVIDQAAAEKRIRTLSSPEAEPESVKITPADIASTVATWKGIPVDQVSLDDRERLKSLASRLRGRVKAQDDVIDAVSEAVQMAYLGLSNPAKPYGVFLFAGPTGVGKTELARALAEQLFGDEKAMLRLDMSEYMEPHSVSRLIGSPPGYVGHEESSLLVDAIRARPFQIILLDEIEKAHDKIVHLFLQVFDDGRLTDTKGRTADFRNTLIVMTSNLGAQEATEEERGEFGFHSLDESTRLVSVIAEAITAHFPPEFIGRLTGVHVFRPLTRATLRQIAEKFVDRLRERVAAHNVKIDLTDDVYDYVIRSAIGLRLGARPLEHNVERLLVAPIARMLLDCPPSGKERTLAVVLEEGRIRLMWDDSLSGDATEPA